MTALQERNKFPFIFHLRHVRTREILKISLQIMNMFARLLQENSFT